MFDSISCTVLEFVIACASCKWMNVHCV